MPALCSGAAGSLLLASCSVLATVALNSELLDYFSYHNSNTGIGALSLRTLSHSNTSCSPPPRDPRIPPPLACHEIPPALTTWNSSTVVIQFLGYRSRQRRSSISF
ncbi:hypothetical protein DFH06DRAFT_1242147, partial [Mycena polygramma]